MMPRPTRGTVLGALGLALACLAVLPAWWDPRFAQAWLALLSLCS